jgi:ABC-2 type transport system ATP-binding protein
MLQLRALCKSYDGTPVLDDVNLDVAAGEICALLGPNGAGKTTCVSIIAGLRRPDSGTVLVGGIDAVAHPRQARELLGLAPQDLGLYPTATVRENLRVFGGIAGLRRAALRTRIDELAAVLQLADLLDRRAGLLSGGQKRRVHTAIALLHRPRVLLLDEPTVGADIETRAGLLDVVRRLAQDGAAVCYTTHYLAEIESLDASVAVLEGGRIIARGSIEALTQSHAPPMVELTFDGPAPDIDVGAPAVRDGDALRVQSSEPAAMAATVIARLGPHGSRLRSVELRRPGLESAYLALTGRRAAVEQEDAHVPAS